MSERVKIQCGVCGVESWRLKYTNKGDGMKRGGGWIKKRCPGRGKKGGGREKREKGWMVFTYQPIPIHTLYHILTGTDVVPR